MDSLPTDYFVTSQAFTKKTYRTLYPAISPSSPANSQAGKTIVITGASKGLGRYSFAASFAHANPKGIVLVARTATSLQEVVKDIAAINPEIRVLAIPTDISDSESVSKMWEEVKSEFGHADILVNNAGVLAGTVSVKDADATQWWSDFEINAKGTFLVSQGFLNLLPPDAKATMITVTSGASIEIYPTMSSYAISKLVPLQLSAYIAAENQNVACISLHPGTVPTDMTTDLFRRFSLDTPELVGGIGVWLASEQARWLSGRYVSANWSVEELVERREEIVGEGKLIMGLQGKFGAEQFA